MEVKSSYLKKYIYGKLKLELKYIKLKVLCNHIKLCRFA